MAEDNIRWRVEVATVQESAPVHDVVSMFMRYIAGSTEPCAVVTGSGSATEMVTR